MREWNAALDRATADGPHRVAVTVAALRQDMDRGNLKHAHLADGDLVTAVRRMELVAQRLPRNPGAAATALLAAMGQ